jgi:hypothetical protein
LEVQENQEELKFSGVHQLVFYADGVYLLGENMDKIKKNTDATLHTI